MVADLDGDGKLDVVAGTATSLIVMYGNGDGTFGTPQTVLTWTGGTIPFSTADMNGDGKPDLVCTASGQILILHNLGQRTFSTPVAIATNTSLGQLVTADFNGDGRPDIAVIANDHPGSTSTDVFIYQNQGGGNYLQMPNVSSIWIIIRLNVADLNGDGKADLLASIVTDIVGTSGASIYWGDGTGHFTDGPGVGTTTSNVTGTVAADFDSDGNLDYVIANFSAGSLSVIRNTGNNTFGTPATYVAGNAPDQLDVADFDNDGAPDIVVENSGQTNITLLRNQNALFPNSVAYPTGAACDSMVVVDINGDGKPDVIVSSLSGNTVSVLLNSTP